MDNQKIKVGQIVTIAEMDSRMTTNQYRLIMIINTIIIKIKKIISILIIIHNNIIIRIKI